MESKESTRIVKAQVARNLGTTVAFNFEDFRRRCDEHVEKVRLQTEQMLTEAQQEAEAIRQKALEAGKAEGYKQGMREAAQQIEKQSEMLAERRAAEKLKTTLPALQAAVQSLNEQRDHWQSHWEETAVRLGIAVAEKLIRRQINVQPETATKMMSEALQLAAGTSQLRIGMNPRDIELLGEHADEVIRSLSGCADATLSPDESISSGGCVIETQHGTIDARIETQLEQIVSELLQ